MGEAGLLALLTAAPRAAVSRPAAPGTVLVGPGDDAAVWQPPPGYALAVSQDAQVEGVDFRRHWMTPHGLGLRAAAAALSDLAATGATPAYLLATLCASGDALADDLLAVHLGLADAAEAAGCVLLGGDLSRIDGPLVVDVHAAGAVDPEALLRRDAGRPGDLLAVTGVLGRAAAGLAQLQAGRAVEPAWLEAQLRPRARLAEGRRLAAGGARCAGDLSDGLLVDADWTARASGCGAELWLDRVPVDARLGEVFGERWVELAIAGGEDFELLAAAAPGVLDGWPAELAPLSVVGRLVDASGVRLLDTEAGRPLPLPKPLSRHFG